MKEPRRFVILTHDHPVLHWDLMFDVGDALRTWRLEQPPQPNVSIAAVALPDHRRMYLDYQGPVSRNRGTVVQWDAGDCVDFTETPQLVTAHVRGDRIQGTVLLTRIGEGGNWRFVLQAGNNSAE